MNATNNNEKGFTIIEVVLVLAIAALIFLMVFIALPALQRSQRDSQRNDDLGRAQTAIQQYQSNNRNTLPDFDDDFTDQYLTVADDTFLDPSGSNVDGDSDTYNWSVNTGTISGTFAETQNTIYVAKDHICSTGGEVEDAGSRKVALRMNLEGGGIACVNN